RRDREDDDNATGSTASGTVLGTASYMSPEQVRSQPADHRSDIFSLGIVLYEMLSQEKPFTGETSAETMTAILKHDPRELWRLGGLSPAVDRIVRRCLEKDPDHRFQSARDVAFALEATTGAESVVGAPRAPIRRSVRWVATLATALCLAFGAYLVGTGKRAASPKPPSF